MTVQIRVKRKYLSGGRSKYKGGEHPAPKRKRKKLSDIAKMKLPPQPKVVLRVNGKTGAGRMEKE